MRKGVRLGLGLGLAAATLLRATHRAAADDWLQFRRDERRTAASRDRLQLPLTDLWSYAGYGTATWHGKAYYLGPAGAQAAVYCADMRTGVTLWKQPLSFSWSDMWIQPPLQRTPVAVTAEGVVYVQDSQPGTHGVVFPRGAGGPKAYLTHPFGPVPRAGFRTFRATDGAPMSRVDSPPRDVPVPQLALYDGAAPAAPETPPVLRGLIPVGPALLQGSEVIASSLDCLFRWTPGGAADLLSLAHLRPPAMNDVPLRDVNLGGFPPTSTGAGMMVGGMAWLDADSGALVGEKQFLAYMQGGKCRWHRDYPWSLGFPTVDSELVLTGAGDRQASWAVMAHDVTTGVVRWVYPRGGPSADASGVATGGGRAVPVAQPHGYLLHPGIAVSDGRAYAVVGRSIVCLSTAKGEPIWSTPFSAAAAEGAPKSIVVTPGHVLVSFNRETSQRSATGFQAIHAGRIVALRLADGKPEWSQSLPAGGDLALSDGMLFQTDDAIHAFAPAERTYRMAVDSSRPEDYDPSPGLNRKVDAAELPAAKQAAGVADASVVRLYWGTPVEQMLEQLRERRAAAPGLPLLVSLDWLDPTRTTLRGGQANWSAQDAAAFAALCERLAREVGPEHLDLAPEVDVYLSRDLSRLPAVRALLRTATAAVKRASPQTRVLISFNREVLSRRYGRGNYSPFGKVVFANQEEQKALVSLFDEVEEIGLTSIPQSAFKAPAEIPGDYLLGLKAALPNKPLLLTRLAMRWDESDKTPEATQASYLKHVIQSAYWINAELVAYPELVVAKAAPGAKLAEMALRVESQDRLALAYWRDSLQWKRVPRLTAAAAEYDAKPRQ